MERGLRKAAAAAAVFAFLGLAGQAFAADNPQQQRDDTKALQRQLDRGGTITLKALKKGRCYQTKGLWVSKNNTTITTRDGACVQYLGPGPVRLRSDDGDPIPADAIFFVNRSSNSGQLPQHVTISNLKLIVPQGGKDGYGVVVAGSDVTLDGLNVQGSPMDAVQVTPRANGRGWAGPVTIRNGRFLAARRNGISVVGAIGVTIDSNVISGAGNPASLGPLGPQLISVTGPWAGIDVEPNIFTYPIRTVMISNNTITGNGGAGVLFALSTNESLPTVADDLTLTGNTITDNAHSNGPFLRGGVCLQGGQKDGQGHLAVTNNTVTNNGGYGFCKHPFDGYNLLLTVLGNVFSGNELGDSEW